jgi:hypothetical protein
MTLCRAVFLFVFAAASTCAFGADPNSSSAASPNTSFQSSRTTPGTEQFVPWFTGTKRLDSQMKFGASTYAVRREASRDSPGMPSENYCLKLRTYKVKRQERFSDNESGFRGYSTCQAVSNYQVRSAVGEQTLQAPPQ